LGAIVTAGVALSACGSNPHAIAACKIVNEAIVTYEHAITVTGEARSAAVAHAQSQLKGAMRDAGQATSEDGTYNALQTTISESARVGMGNVVPSLRAQCSSILDPHPFAPKGP
jgi:hypothetical protein